MLLVGLLMAATTDALGDHYGKYNVADLAVEFCIIISILALTKYLSPITAPTMARSTSFVLSCERDSPVVPLPTHCFANYDPSNALWK